MRLQFKQFDKFKGTEKEHIGDLGLIIEDVEELGDNYNLISNVNNEKFLNYNKVLYYVAVKSELRELEELRKELDKIKSKL